MSSTESSWTCLYLRDSPRYHTSTFTTFTIWISNTHNMGNPMIMLAPFASAALDLNLDIRGKDDCDFAGHGDRRRWMDIFAPHTSLREWCAILFNSSSVWNENVAERCKCYLEIEKRAREASSCLVCFFSPLIMRSSTQSTKTSVLDTHLLPGSLFFIAEFFVLFSFFSTRRQHSFFLAPSSHKLAIEAK